MGSIYAKECFDTILKPAIDKKVNSFLSVFHIKEKLEWVSENDKSSYVYYDGTYHVNIGHGMPEKFIKKKKLSDSEYEDLIKNYLIGLIYHELGHVCFTDMSFNLVDYVISKGYVINYSVAYQFINILEDIFIERYGMSRIFPFTRKYFDIITEHTVNPKKKYCYTDSQFMTFLLMYLRKPKSEVTCEFYEKNKSTIDSKIKTYFSIKNPTNRMEYGVEFFYWVCRNNPSIEFSKVIDKIISSSCYGPGLGRGTEGGEKPDSDFDEILKDDETSSDSMDKLSKSISDSYSSWMADKIDSYAEKEASMRSIKEVKPNPDSKTGFYGNSINGHVFIDIDSNIKSISDDEITRKTELFDETIAKNSEICKNLVKTVMTIKERSIKRDEHNQIRGDLNIKTIIKYESKNILPPPTIFKSKKLPVDNSNFAISLLCDNSGSMGAGGEKAKLAYEASCMFAQVCEQLRIPYEVNLFTAQHDGIGTGEDYTVSLKPFKSSLERRKHYISAIYARLMAEEKNPVPYFAGNRDEVQVLSAYERLRKEPYKKILFIVMSDGQPTGDNRDLRIAVSKLEADRKFEVFGIGMCSDSVRSYYKNNCTFMSLREMKKLPEFLAEMIKNSVIENNKK